MEKANRLEPLFTAVFYKAGRTRLHPGGMMTVQSGAPFFQPRELEMVCERLSRSFAGVRPYLASLPTDAGGMLALVAAGESRDALRPPCKVLRERFAPLQGRTRYYTPEVHRAAFTLAPSFQPSSLRNDAMPIGFLKTGT